MCRIQLFIFLSQLLVASHLVSAMWELNELLEIQQLVFCRAQAPQTRLVTFRRIALMFSSFSNEELTGIISSETSLRNSLQNAGLTNLDLSHYSYFASRSSVVPAQQVTAEGLEILLREKFTVVYLLEAIHNKKRGDQEDTAGENTKLFFSGVGRMIEIPVYTGVFHISANEGIPVTVVKHDDLFRAGIVCTEDTVATTADKQSRFSIVCEDMPSDATGESTLQLPQKHIIFVPLM